MAAVGSRRIPSYRHHKGSGQAVVTIDGRDVYLGRFGSIESRREYDRLVGEWMAHGRTLPTSAGGSSDLSVNELLAGYLTHAQQYYRKHDRPTLEADNIRVAIRVVRQLYGHTAARDFGPLALKAVRQRMMDDGLCRNECNKRTGKIVRAFRWGVENQLVPADVYHGLKAVMPLRKGRCEARETAPVRPVPEEHVEAVRPLVTPTVRAMIDVQIVTGMRPGEVCQMRTRDLDTEGPVWSYRPGSHKTEHHGKDRCIHLGPKAQAILKDWLRPEDPDGYLFSPRRAMEALLASRRAGRRSPMTPSQRARKPKARPKRAPGECYDPRSYAHAIRAACDRAGVPKWGPNRLRHLAATRLRRQYGLDVARVILGHSSPAVTAIYAEADHLKAAAVMAEVG